MVIPSTPAAPAFAFTRRQAAASTSARCTSPYRLQNRYSGLDFAFRYRVICSCRTFSGAVSPCGPSPRPSLRFSPAEQVASLRSSADSPNQRSGTASSLLRTPPTPVLARTAFPFGVVPPVESSLLAITGLPAYPSVTCSTCRPRRPRRSIVEARDGWSGHQLCGLRQKLRSSAAGSILSRLIYGSPILLPPLVPGTAASVVHMFIATCRFDSMPAPHPASRRRSWHGLRC